MTRGLLSLVAILLLPASAALAENNPAAQPAFRPLQDYRLDLELNLTAPFPFLQKFGVVDVAIFPQGVRATALGMLAVSRTGTKTISVANPGVRLYVDIAVSELSPVLVGLSGSSSEGELIPGLSGLSAALLGEGTVSGIPSSRYRVILGEKTWIDVWTTKAIPENPHVRLLSYQIVKAMSKHAADLVTTIPGMPVYLEVNTTRFKKVPLLRVKAVTRSSAGADEDLELGSFYGRAAVVEALWK